jgi:triosephosphate isomerase (TIM)
MARTPLIAGNWKMHKTGQEARDFVHALSAHLEDTETRIYLSVPFTAIEQAAEAAAASRIVIGAQNMHDEPEGAFTGEISARMLKAAGAEFVLIGHSERRQHFGETGAFINRKIHRAIAEGLLPILCIGETALERDEHITQRVLSKQLEEALNGLSAHQIGQMVIAYEPIWAIGTGKTATPDAAQEVHHAIRQFILHSCGNKTAEEICLLYGGSVKPDNIGELMKEADIDGALVGGASLDAASFAQIIHF